MTLQSSFAHMSLRWSPLFVPPCVWIATCAGYSWRTLSCSNVYNVLNGISTISQRFFKRFSPLNYLNLNLDTPAIAPACPAYPECMPWSDSDLRSLHTCDSGTTKLLKLNEFSALRISAPSRIRQPSRERFERVSGRLSLSLFARLLLIYNILTRIAYESQNPIASSTVTDSTVPGR